MTVLNLQVGSGQNGGFDYQGFNWNTSAASWRLANGTNWPYWALWTRFTSVTIAQGTALTSAVISMYSLSDAYSGTSVKLKTATENVDNSTMPTSNADARTRTLSTDSTWAEITSDPAADTWYSQDITATVQTVIDRAGWASGNAMGLRTRDNGSTNGSDFTARMYDGDSTKAAKLDITYAAGGGSDPIYSGRIPMAIMVR